MILYGLRLLVALLTFAFGVAAAWLFGSGPSKNCKTTVGLTGAPGVTAVDRTRKSCSLPLELPKHVVQGGMLDFKAVKKPAAVYPLAAKAAGVNGTVIVRVMVDVSGEVLTAEAKSGPAQLREAAETAAREARFTPTLLSGRPVKVEGDITYNFWLR